MPKNIKGGKGHKKGKNKPTAPRQTLITKDGPEQNYGLITKALGDLRFTMVDPNNMTYTARVRGKMKGRQRVRPGDMVLFSYRETGERKVDIILKYTDEQANRIIRAEDISFPEGDHKLGHRSAHASVVFDDDAEVEVEATVNVDSKSGYDRIMALYQEDDGSDEDGSDEDGSNEEYEDEDEEDEDEEDVTDEDENDKYDNDPIKTAKKTYGKERDRKHNTAAQCLTGDGDIDIDAI